MSRSHTHSSRLVALDERLRRAAGPAIADSATLAAQIEPFDSFWEGPHDVAKGYRTFGQFYCANYLQHLPTNRSVRVLVISCGPGYFVHLLRTRGYKDVQGIDSDPEKISHAQQRGLNCHVARAFEYLLEQQQSYDVIICEQELNHLTKSEMVSLLQLILARLQPGGLLVCHGLNGANPIVGAETLAQNFDHYNTLTEYSLRQVLQHCGFTDIKTFGLHLYVFYWNPANYIAWAAAATFSLTFRLLFALYGKSNRIFTKKIAAVAAKPLSYRAI